MTEIELLTMATLGFFTGLGTTFGAELAREVFAKSKRVLERNKHAA